MPEPEFEAILAPGAEEGTKRALTDVGHVWRTAVTVHMISCTSILVPPSRRWVERFPVRETAFTVETPPAREILAQSRIRRRRCGGRRGAGLRA
jgi:hypothetical protein